MCCWSTPRGLHNKPGLMDELRKIIRVLHAVDLGEQATEIHDLFMPTSSAGAGRSIAARRQPPGRRNKLLLRGCHGARPTDPGTTAHRRAPAHGPCQLGACPSNVCKDAILKFYCPIWGSGDANLSIMPVQVTHSFVLVITRTGS
jgi:hypothetical protein